jgi:hypothetical protein
MLTPTLMTEPQCTNESTQYPAEHKSLEDPRAMNEYSSDQRKTTEGIAPSANKWIRCDTLHCGSPAVGLLALRFFCLGHFIAQCYERLERCNSNPLNDADVVTSGSVDRFLQQVVCQTGELVRPSRGFDNLDRARLFDIFLWAADLVEKRSIFKSAISTTSEANRDSVNHTSSYPFKKAVGE